MKQHNTGFTLIELMVALAMTMILVSVAFSEMHNQTLAFQRILERTALSQSARSALDFITDNLRQAGYGFAYDDTLADPGGVLAIGSCADPAGTPLGAPDLFTCDAGLPSNGVTPIRRKGDMFRIAFMDPKSTRPSSVRVAAPAAEGPLTVVVLTNVVDSTNPIPLQIGRLAIVSGLCTATGAPMNRAVIIDDARSVNGPSGYQYQLTLHPVLNGSAGGCGLDAWAVGSSVRIGYGVIRDFYYEAPLPGSTATGNLMMRDWRSGSEPPAELLARQIEDIHIAYAFEQSKTSPNGILDEGLSSYWCDGIVADGCIKADWTPPDAWQRAHRIIGVQVLIVMRTRTSVAALISTPLPTETPIPPLNTSILLFGDGFQRYPFSTTVALNNRGLRKL